jgi:hypothetical protein
MQTKFNKISKIFFFDKKKKGNITCLYLNYLRKKIIIDEKKIDSKTCVY